MSEHLALFRIARRDALRAKGRSGLIVLMVMLPVFALTFVDVLVRTSQPDLDEEVTCRLGATQYVLRADAPIGAGFMQAPNPEEGSHFAGSGGEAGKYANPAALLPAGGRILTAASAEVDVRTQAGTALVGWQEVAAADPAFAGRYELLSGRAPRSRAEVLATPELLERAGIHVGDTLTVIDPAAEVTVVGTVRQAGTLDWEAVFALPGTLVGRRDGISRSAVFESLVYVAEAPSLTWEQVVALNAQGVSAYDRNLVLDPPPRSRIAYYADGGGATSSDQTLNVLLTGAVALLLAGLEVVLLAGAAFAVGTRRQARALALLVATGASPRHVRQVVLAGGLVLGAVAALLGVAGGILAAALARPLLDRYAHISFARFDVRPLELLAIGLFAVVSGLLAAVIPARTVARQDAVAALAGRRGQVSTRLRVPLAGVALTSLGIAAATIASLWVATGNAGAASDAGNLVAAAIAGGTGFAVIGLVVLSPALMGLAGRLGARLPLAPRLAMRDAARHRGRSAPAMAAVLVAVAGGATLLLYVAALDDHDRRAYVNQLPAGTAGVPLLDYVLDGPEDIEPRQVLRRAAPVIRAVSSKLLTRSTSIVRMTRSCASASCRTAVLTVPRAGSSGDGFDSSFGFVVASASEFERLYGERRDAARVLAAGGVVVPDAGQLVDGRAHFDLYAGESARSLATVRLPAVALAAEPLRSFGPGVLSPAAARRLRLPVVPGYVLFDLDRLPTEAEEDAAGDALRAAGVTGELAVERGYVSEFGIGLLALVVGAGIITLAAAGIATGLAQADARPDYATLAAVGADPRLRRSLAALQALVIAGLGTVLGAAVAFVPATALIGAIATLHLVLPLVQLVVLLVGVPLLAAAAAWLCTRSRMPMDRRLAR